MKRIGLFFLCLIILLFTPGCWDMQDVNDTAFALTMGIDAPGSSDSATYKVTLEFAAPVKGNPMPKSLVASAEADSILQAVQKIQTGISREISFSHLRVVLIGEDIAKQANFKDLSNYLMKEPQVALRLRMLFIENNNAHTLLKRRSQNSDLLASELVSMGQSQLDLSLVRTNHFYNFWSNLNTANGTALGSRVALDEEEKKIIREGAAIYQDWKLKEWLNAQEAQYANWLLEDTKPIVVAKDGENRYTYRISTLKNKITPSIINGSLTFSVQISTTGQIMEEAGEDLDFSKEKNLKKVEALFSRTIKDQVEAALEKSQQELKIDYLGFGKALKQHEPTIFNSINWQETYPQVPIRIEVNTKVKSSGMQS